MSLAQTPTPHPADGALVLVLAAPWLWPVAVGPTPTTLPWLFSMACAAVAWLLRAWVARALPRLVPLLRHARTQTKSHDIKM